MKALQMCLEHARVNQHRLSEAFRKVAKWHERDYDVHSECKLFTDWSRKRQEKLNRFCDRYGTTKYVKEAWVGGRLHAVGRSGGYGLLRDLEDLLLLAHESRVAWTVLGQVAKAMKDAEMKEVAEDCGLQAEREIDWLCTHIKNVAPQVLTVPEPPQKELLHGSAKVIVLLGIAVTGLLAVTGRRFNARTEMDSLSR